MQAQNTKQVSGHKLVVIICQVSLWHQVKKLSMSWGKSSKLQSALIDEHQRDDKKAIP